VLLGDIECESMPLVSDEVLNPAATRDHEQHLPPLEPVLVRPLLGAAEGIKLFAVDLPELPEHFVFVFARQPLLLRHGVFSGPPPSGRSRSRLALRRRSSSSLALICAS